jgi:uncharacterized membrane protein YcjF (UPF0283 family)
MNRPVDFPHPFREPRIHWAQFGMLILFCLYAAGIVYWIVHLIRLSFELDDTSSLSVAISAVAVPMFIALVAIVNYVFWGLLLNQNEVQPEPDQGERPT